MPKSSKKKKEKAADFSRAKLKLGKGKQVPSNVVNTSYKARTIALPTQSIAIEKDDTVPTTKRKLSFDDLISHMKHHNAGARKDAIMGMRELLEAHQHLIDASLQPLVNACVRMIGDEDASVRRSLLSFFSWLMPLLSAETISPHFPLLMLFTTSAQTHIFPEIRIDAIKFLDLFMRISPNTVIAGWAEGSSGHGRRTLMGYLGLLSAGTKFGDAEGAQATSIASVVLSSQSRLVVLNSLSTFLAHALLSEQSSYSSVSSEFNAASTPLPTWYFEPSFCTPEASAAYNSLFRPRYSKIQIWQPEIDLESLDENFVIQENVINPSTSQYSLQDLSEISELPVGSDDIALVNTGVDITVVARLAHTLHSVLISTFLDCAPSVFSPSSIPPEPELKLVVAVCEITRTLYSPILQHSSIAPRAGLDTAIGELKTSLGYMSTYFPFRSSHRDIKIEQAFQELNVIYCELQSLVILSSHSPPARSYHKATNPSQHYKSQVASASRPDLKTDAIYKVQADLISTFVIRSLRGESTSGDNISRPLTSDMYIALLPTIWSLLNKIEGVDSKEEKTVAERIFEATIEHATKTTSGSAVKRLTVEFVSRLALLHTQFGYQNHFTVDRINGREKFEEWIVHLPKTLWELGSNNLKASEAILRFFLLLLQRGTNILNHELVMSIHSRLIPYFTISHATKGLLPGPFSKIPLSHTAIRRLALDVSVTLVAIFRKSSRSASGAASDQKDALSRAIEITVKGTSEEEYWSSLERAMAHY